MQVRTYTIDGIMYLRDISHWRAEVNLGFQSEGDVVAHSIKIIVRVKGTEAQTYLEAEAAILAKARQILLLATDTLEKHSGPELSEYVAEARAQREQAAQDEADAAIARMFPEERTPE